ncbi:hypothetical protein EOPP23_10780 [Endozoicomonas sp. OPT23]|uniref:hypothetical protein n=1 Tax=Endozoicomonas sp. OPT23 TaxID=2072845 RepID=UPI00129AAB06|nr:hypothetical protein [Endozoicomonas sp. OPT23]MRI33469.1 hypothetical protein [Endozoicomonas sp. OPT23]
MAIRLDPPWLLEEQEEEQECYEDGLILPPLIRIEGFSDEVEMSQRKRVSSSLIQLNSHSSFRAGVTLELGKLPERKVKRKVLLRYP